MSAVRFADSSQTFREVREVPNKRHHRVCNDVRMANEPVFRVTVATSDDDLQPVQAAARVTGDEATTRQGGKRLDRSIDFEARDLASCAYVPQPDRLIR